jgi:prophage maintenance system killer protein/REP element-mobilizing transposase RayT
MEYINKKFKIEMISMPRTQRLKISDETAVYHVMSRTALDGFPLGDSEKDFMLDLIRRYATLYFVEILGFCLVGNHFHLLVKMFPDHKFTDEQIKKRYEEFYGDDRTFSYDQVPSLRQKLSDLSEFVREIKVGFARFYNRRHTPKTMEALCRNYRETCNDERVPPLLIVATFVFDLLCIHPFRDGNGRISRLATTLLLQAHSFQVARYVSLERLIEESKEDYYATLADCSLGWHEGKNEIIHWWNYFLSVLRRAYIEFERQVESTEARPAKSDLVRQTVLAQLEQFTLGDLATQLPAASPQLIKKVLSELKNQGKIRLIGRGRGARWEIIIP